MDDRRFDRLTRAFAIAASRRKALLGAAAIGATALVSSRRSEAQSPAPDASTLCAGDGQPCVMLTGCCSGFTCVTSAINPNQGFCQSGGTGGVQIAPPLTAANADGSTTQAAPTRTPRPRKTHTPGSNHTNTSTRPTTSLKVTEISCYPHPSDTIGPHVTVRNVGTDPVTLGNLATLRNPNFNDPVNGKDLPITQDTRLRPQRSITFLLADHSSGGHDSHVNLPDPFFSTAKDDIGKEGVKVTYSGTSGSSLTVTAMCPDKPDTTTQNSQSSRTTRKKKRHR